LTLGRNGAEIDSSCPHREHFTGDDVFIEHARVGLHRIIEDIEKTIALSKSSKD
jgi:hypothetical protein